METKTKGKYINLKFYAGFQVVREIPLPATEDQVIDLWEGLGRVFIPTCGMFTPHGELVLTIHSREGMYQIGSKTIDSLTLNQLLNDIFGYQLNQ